MKNFAIVALACLVTACGIQEKPSSASLTSENPLSFDFSGKDGQDVFKALQDMSVIDTDNLVGAVNLKVEALRCSKLIYAPEGDDGQPSCEFIAKNRDGSREIKHFGGKPSATLLDVLSRHGAAINGGINADAVAAKVLRCSLAVYPNAVPRCTLEI